MEMSTWETRIYEKLCDDESKAIFWARKLYAQNDSLSELYESIRKLSYNYVFRDMDSFLMGKHISKWCVFSEDDIGIYHYKVLSDAGYNVIGIVDDDKCVDLLSDNETALLITREKQELLPDEIRNNDNILSVENHLVGRYGWQYFDFFSPNEGEIFVDGGALDGATSKAFIRWCNGAYKKIYAFEPNPDVIDICRNSSAIDDNDKFVFFDKALWRDTRKMRFDNFTKSRWDACVCEDGNVCIDATSIDETVRDNNVTFIKLDVEGSELEALEGAQRSIKRCKPRMAISVYHKKMDYVDLSMSILEMNPAYRLALRHYHSDAIETVLYVY